MKTLAQPPLAIALFLVQGAVAQVMDYSLVPNSPSYEAAAAPLRAQPPGEYKFTEAALGDVLQLLADEAGMSFFSLPNDVEAARRMVTFTIQSSPFLALETLAKANGVALIHENGVWYLRPENDTSLIGRVYQIQYNSREMIRATQSGGNIGAVTTGPGGSGGGSGGGNTTTASSGVNLQGSTQSFEVEPSQLLADIKELLGISAAATPVFAGVTTVDALALGGGASEILLPNSGVRGPQASGSKVGESAKVIWNGDSNTLYVVATRQQHAWIEGYLAAADRPQDQIAIEVKFIETTRDPSVEFGVDWTGTLEDGYEVNVSNDGDPLTSPFNPSRPGDFQLPTTGIVSFEQINARLRALAFDSSTKSVSYPRMVTTNNREVVLRSVVNQPVLAGSSSSSLGAGAITAQAISYLPIGTVLNILPKRMGDGKIQLNIALTVSRVIGEEIIGGNPFPIASSRVYNAPVEVDSGYTVAIGGLDEANWEQTEAGVPVLRKLPVLGYAFKSRGAGRSRQSLMIMITPRVIDPRGGGLPDKPESAIRVTPEDPPAPTILADGTLVANLDGLEQSLVRLRREVDVLEAEVDQMHAEEEQKEQLFALFTSVRNTRAKLKEWSKTYPELSERIGAYNHQYALLEQRLEGIQRRARWMLY
jgi:hypothetical protein